MPMEDGWSVFFVKTFNCSKCNLYFTFLECCWKAMLPRYLYSGIFYNMLCHLENPFSGWWIFPSCRWLLDIARISTTRTASKRAVWTCLLHKKRLIKRVKHSITFLDKKESLRVESSHARFNRFSADLPSLFLKAKHVHMFQTCSLANYHIPAIDVRAN